MSVTVVAKRGSSAAGDGGAAGVASTKAGAARLARGRGFCEAKGPRPERELAAPAESAASLATTLAAPAVATLAGVSARQSASTTRDPPTTGPRRAGRTPPETPP